MSKRRNPYKKSKRTYIDEGVMKRIGWSEEDVICFVKDVEEEEKVETKNEEDDTKKMINLMRLLFSHLLVKSRLFLLPQSRPQQK